MEGSLVLRRQKKKGIKDRKLGPPLLRRIILPAVLLPYQPPKVLNVNHLLLQLRDLKDPEDDYGSEEEDEDEEDGEGEGEGEEDDEGEGEGGGKAALVKVSTGPKVFPKAYRVGDEDPPPEEGEEDEEEEEEEEEGPSPEELRAAYLKKLAALMLDIYKFTLKYIHFDEACATLQVAVTYPTNIEDGPNMRATVIRMQIQKGAFEHAYNNLEGIIRDYPRDVAVVSSLLTAAALSRRMGFYDRAAEQISKLCKLDASLLVPFTPVECEFELAWTWEMNAEEIGNLKLAAEAAQEYIAVFQELAPDTTRMWAEYEAKIRAEEAVIQEKLRVRETLMAARLEAEALAAAARAKELDEAAAKAEADARRAGSSAAQAKAAAKRVRFEAAQALAQGTGDGDAAAGGATPGAGAGAPAAALPGSKAGKPPLDVTKKPLPTGPFKSKLDRRDDLLTMLSPKALRKHTPQAHRELNERATVWRSHPTTWMRRGDWFRERENVVLASDSYLEALRLAGLRLRDSEEMGRRPPNVPNLTALRRLERHGWKTMKPLVQDFDEAKVLTDSVMALGGKERGLYWLAVAQCAMASADASLTSFAFAMYDRYFHLFTFKFDDRPFLRMIGRAEVARRMEHRSIFFAACFISRTQKRIKWQVIARRATYAINKWFRANMFRWRVSLRLPARRRIQPHWKGWCQRRAFVRMRTAMHAAATQLRAVWKMHLQRSTLDRLREARLQLFIASTIVLQAFVRFKIQRLKYLDLRGAAVLVQGFYRASLARREHALLMKHRLTVLAERTDAGTDESMATVGCNTIPRGLVRRCTSIKRVKSMKEKFYAVPDMSGGVGSIGAGTGPASPSAGTTTLGGGSSRHGGTALAAKGASSTGAFGSSGSTLSLSLSSPLGGMSEAGNGRRTLGGTLAHGPRKDLTVRFDPGPDWEGALKQHEEDTVEGLYHAKLKEGGAGMSTYDGTQGHLRSWQPSVQSLGGNSQGVDPVMVPAVPGAGVPARLLPKAAAEPSQFPEVRRLGHLELKAAEAERKRLEVKQRIEGQVTRVKGLLRYHDRIKAEEAAADAVAAAAPQAKEAGEEEEEEEEEELEEKKRHAGAASPQALPRWAVKPPLGFEGLLGPGPRTSTTGSPAVGAATGSSPGRGSTSPPPRRHGRRLVEFGPQHPPVSYTFLTRVRRVTLRTWQLRVRLVNNPLLHDLQFPPVLTRLEIANRPKGSKPLPNPNHYRNPKDTVPGVDVYTSHLQYLRLPTPEARLGFLEARVPPLLWANTALFLAVPRPHGTTLRRQQYLWHRAVDEAHALAQTKVLNPPRLEFVAAVGASGGGVGYLPSPIRVATSVSSRVTDIPPWYNAGKRPVPPDLFLIQRAKNVAAAKAKEAAAMALARKDPLTSSQLFDAHRTFGRMMLPGDKALRVANPFPRTIADLVHLPAGSNPGPRPSPAHGWEDPGGGAGAGFGTEAGVGLGTGGGGSWGSGQGTLSPGGALGESSASGPGTVGGLGATWVDQAWGTSSAGAPPPAAGTLWVSTQHGGAGRTSGPAMSGSMTAPAGTIRGAMGNSWTLPTNVAPEGGQEFKASGFGSSPSDGWGSPGVGVLGGGTTGSPSGLGPTPVGNTMGMSAPTWHAWDAVDARAVTPVTGRRLASREQKQRDGAPVEAAPVSPAAMPEVTPFYRHMSDQFYAVRSPLSAHIESQRRFNKQGAPVGAKRLQELGGKIDRAGGKGKGGTGGGTGSGSATKVRLATTLAGIAPGNLEPDGGLGTGSAMGLLAGRTAGSPGSGGALTAPSTGTLALTATAATSVVSGAGRTLGRSATGGVLARGSGMTASGGVTGKGGASPAGDPFDVTRYAPAKLPMVLQHPLQREDEVDPMHTLVGKRGRRAGEPTGPTSGVLRSGSVASLSQGSTISMGSAGGSSVGSSVLLRPMGTTMTCVEERLGQSKVDYADTIMALSRTAMGWMTAKPHVVRDLFINLLEDLMRTMASAHHARCDVTTCDLVDAITRISVRVVRAPMPAEQLLSVMFDLKSLASQLLASGPAPAASPKAVAATEDVVLSELAAEAKRMRQGLEGGMLTQKECKVSLQTTLTRELKAKHWVAALECLTTMHDLGLVPSAPSLAAFVQTCAGMRPPVTGSMPNPSPLTVATRVLKIAAARRIRLAGTEYDATVRMALGWGTWRDCMTTIALYLKAYDSEGTGTRPTDTMESCLMQACRAASGDDKDTMFDVAKVHCLPFDLCFKVGNL